MGGLKLDFGLLIAYVVPGVLLLYGIAPFVPQLQELLTAGESQSAVVTGIVIGALSIVAGMGVSIIRFQTVDRTFSLDIPFSNYDRYPYHRSIPPSEIDYGQLKKEGALNAYLEAKLSEKRPQQFYGNVLVVALVVSLVRLLGPLLTDVPRTGTALWIVAAFGAVFVLYPASRHTYSKYVNAVRRINEP